MKKSISFRARFGGLLLAAVVLASCYAPIANQEGYLSLDVQFGERAAVVGTPQIVVLVIDSVYRAELAETLYLISKGAGSGLSASEQDRLVELGKLMATHGLVKFGGYPFYQATISGTSGSFRIPAVPAGRSYFVKIFVLEPSLSFDVQNLNEDFFDLLQFQNYVFANNDDWGSIAFSIAGWNPVASQPVAVRPGEAAGISVPLSPTP